MKIINKKAGKYTRQNVISIYAFFKTALGNKSTCGASMAQFKGFRCQVSVFSTAHS